MPTEAELTKLKVAELQKLLKEKGLPSTGKKDELVARLAAADSEPAAAAAPAAEAKPAAAAAAAAAAAPKAAAPEGAAAAAAAVGEEKAAAAEEEAAEDTEKNPLEMTEDERRAARAAKFGLPIEPSAAKTLKAEKIAARAERFKGELTASGGGGGKGGVAATGMTPEELEKRKRRAERFGIPETAPAPAVKGNAPAKPIDPEMAKKLEEREKRFKSA